jgi:hypothetical protein
LVIQSAASRYTDYAIPALEKEKEIETEGKREGAKKQREPGLAHIEEHYAATPLHM